MQLAYPATRVHGFLRPSLSTSLLRALYVPSSRSPIKILNHTSPGINPWGMPLVIPNWLPGGLLMADHHPLSLTVLPIFHPINHPLIQALFHQFGFDHIMGNCQRSFKVDVYSIQCSPSSRAKKAIRLFRDDLSLVNQCLLSKLPSCLSCAWSYLYRAWG